MSCHNEVVLERLKEGRKETQRRVADPAPRPAPSGAHLDSADQSFLLTAMLQEPRVAARAPPAAASPGAPPPPAQVGSHGRLSHPRAPRPRSDLSTRERPLGCGRPRQSRIDRSLGRPRREAASAGWNTDGRPGPAWGWWAAPGEGGRLPAQNQSDQIGAGPPPRAVSRPGVPGSWAGGKKLSGKSARAFWAPSRGEPSQFPGFRTPTPGPPPQ
ncbi:hypothetical protein P7K49_035664 [Saguinus oedipus]|uniref:Uncharacterized protein n=1 Tax=Saguinus oedipus TaxID=9490 RepID=A0ABQ9TN95_SAGOE|nr:hypothetical protein P7K49_035664 [Saguinus oedipus]